MFFELLPRLIAALQCVTCETSSLLKWPCIYSMCCWKNDWICEPLPFAWLILPVCNFDMEPQIGHDWPYLKGILAHIHIPKTSQIKGFNVTCSHVGVQKNNWTSSHHNHGLLFVFTQRKAGFRQVKRQSGGWGQLSSISTWSLNIHLQLWPSTSCNLVNRKYAKF